MLVRMDAVSDELVEAIGRVVDTYGWAGATAERIADAAGINRTTLYRKGLTKERLLDAAITVAAESFLAEMMEPMLQNGTARERLEAVLEAVCRTMEQNLGLLAGLFDGPTTVFHLDGALPTTRFEYVQPLERLLRDGAVDGTLVSSDPEGDAELMFNALVWTYVHLRRTHLQQAKTVTPAVIRLALGFVRPGQPN